MKNMSKVYLDQVVRAIGHREFDSIVDDAGLIKLPKYLEIMSKYMKKPFKVGSDSYARIEVRPGHSWYINAVVYDEGSLPRFFIKEGDAATEWEVYKLRDVAKVIKRVDEILRTI